MKPRPVQHIRRMLIGFPPKKRASSLAIEVEREVVAKSTQFSSRFGEHRQQGMSTPPEGLDFREIMVGQLCHLIGFIGLDENLGQTRGFLEVAGPVKFGQHLFIHPLRPKPSLACVESSCLSAQRRSLKCPSGIAGLGPKGDSDVTSFCISYA